MIQTKVSRYTNKTVVHNIESLAVGHEGELSNAIVQINHPLDLDLLMEPYCLRDSWMKRTHHMRSECFYPHTSYTIVFYKHWQMLQCYNVTDIDIPLLRKRLWDCQGPQEGDVMPRTICDLSNNLRHDYTTRWQVAMHVVALFGPTVLDVEHIPHPTRFY